MKKLTIALWLVIVFVGCRTLDLEKMDIDEHEETEENEDEPAQKTELELAVEEIQASVDVQSQIVYVERPIYIPSPERPITGPSAGIDSVTESTKMGTIKPSDYSHAARIYDYDPDQVYEVYCQVLRTTDIQLEAGELVIDSPFVSDSERWIIGAGVHQDKGQIIQHIYIKPKTASLNASLIINTNRRVYHVILSSYNSVYMPMVKFRYLNQGFPQRYINDITKEIEIATGMDKVNPEYLSFNYKMTFNIFKKPQWLAERVYDDGQKTYIVFDEQILQKELPGIFEKNSDIINYRVQKNLIIIDKLIEKVSVKFNGEKFTISKKRG